MLVTIEKNENDENISYEYISKTIREMGRWEKSIVN